MTPSFQRPFVYGKFRWLGPPTLPTTPPFKGIGMPPARIPNREPDVAIEVLREFSATELVGKVHVRVSDRSWMVLQVDDLPSQPWSVGYQQHRNSLLFDMRLSDTTC
jgi:hypothetical protein